MYYGNGNDTAWSFVIGALCGAIAGIILWAWLYAPLERGYKHGQIDALTGNIKYELVTQPDSTKTWEKHVD